MNHLTTPAHGFMFAILMLGWLGCSELGLDVAFIEALTDSETASSQETTSSSDRPGFGR